MKARQLFINEFGRLRAWVPVLMFIIVLSIPALPLIIDHNQSVEAADKAVNICAERIGEPYVLDFERKALSSEPMAVQCGKPDRSDFAAKVVQK